MAYQPDTLARVRARVKQGSVQRLSRRKLPFCKGCNGSVQTCLTYMRIHARMYARVSSHKTLATVATLAPSLSIPFFLKGLGQRDPARVAQGLDQTCKGLTPPGGVKTGGGAKSLDRCPSHAETFFSLRGFLRGWTGFVAATGVPRCLSASPVVAKGLHGRGSSGGQPWTRSVCASGGDALHRQGGLLARINFPSFPVPR